MAFQELEKNSSGIVQNLTLPARLFHELCSKIITQKLFGKFAEAEQNNPSYQKMYHCTQIAELIAPITNKWEEVHVQFMPKLQKVEWTDNQTPASGTGGDVALTRAEAKKRVGTAER